MVNPDYGLFNRKCPPPPPCEDTDWTPTGVERCTATEVLVEEMSNCGTLRITTTRPFTWIPTGEERCRGDDVLRQEANDCGRLQWVVDRAQTWTPTGETRCKNDLVENEEANDCGDLRFTATEVSCAVYCPSMRISCDGQPGYGFHEMDPPDPLATVVMEPCAGDTSVDPIRIYPTAGPGHTVRVNDCDGVLKGYAVNKSDCAPDCGCPKDPVINVTNKFAPTTNVAAPNVTTNVAAPDVTVALPAPNLVAHALSDTGVLTSTLSNGATVTSNPLPSC